MQRNRLLAVLVVVAVLALGACSSDDGTAAPEPGGPGGEEGQSPPADCRPARDVEGTDEPQAVEVDGEQRTYLLDLPDGYDGATAHPLVLNFHGAGGDKDAHDSYTEMSQLGTARGYVVVTPEAVDGLWNYLSEGEVDDFGFVDTLLADLGERLCLDMDRIYAAGHSDGSGFTGFLVCQGAHQLAAVAMVAAFVPRLCEPSDAAPSVIAFHGTDDPVVPYEGGEYSGGPNKIPPALETLDSYAKLYECDQPPVETEPTEGVEVRTSSGCTGGSEVELHSIAGGGHAWPGNSAGQDIGGQPGSGLLEIPATETILDFFDEHPG